MRQATALDLQKGQHLIDTENHDLMLLKRHNMNTWLAIDVKDNHLEVVSTVDVHKYKVKE